MNEHIVAVRQNLGLVVDHGALVVSLAANDNRRWGSPKNQLQYTSRSGLGTTATGDLVYVAGTNMTLTVLARALAEAGALEAMELDIHGGMTFCSIWAPNSGGVLSPTKLLPTMEGPVDRYLAPDRRDFFYVTTSRSSTDPVRHGATVLAGESTALPGVRGTAWPVTGVRSG
ncbi:MULTISPECIES: phosphodiester glycosidase family protein [unclassified Rhodococcus (in: high G+C Gram-positive bacteria)]|uniref:phosphodiester glycosidase family protein n=1 Tax=unclassified Rhodococcus (in: high G+C Gram-positive bacteria) TaxID=192944 RepID=UPI001639E592|nr:MULTISPECIES: phosphodiester glycosidase family protein [unclassified Rhodococcus (in: high G+C Gram-positive bacteria)]MBC2644568.1 hypothetical protein [Rhodococcus sp. 3A]MBC2897743.1 hypothetical protein [Rhodococcus sp. 4CII]